MGSIGSMGRIGGIESSYIPPYSDDSVLTCWELMAFPLFAPRPQNFTLLHRMGQSAPSAIVDWTSARR
jgi:hypothetical protein